VRIPPRTPDVWPGLAPRDRSGRRAAVPACSPSCVPTWPVPSHPGAHPLIHQLARRAQLLHQRLVRVPQPMRSQARSDRHPARVRATDRVPARLQGGRKRPLCGLVRARRLAASLSAPTRPAHGTLGNMKPGAVSRRAGCGRCDPRQVTTIRQAATAARRVVAR
jgi:hypothetical protein